ncbi:MAG: LemA family protein, partial [Bacillota bacterium]|nr:LemA family protein [Bacillota bacterium]
NQLQRRYDLIPNLVETVKGYTRHEEAVFKELADARSRYAGAATPQEKMAAAGQLESALGRLLVVVENYPNLKADQRFAQLQDELAGTENRIAVERMRYNQAVRRYNATIRRLPYNILASLFNFQPREYFEAAGGAQEAPKVQF